MDIQVNILDNILEKRIFIFVFICVPIRILLIYISKNINIMYLPYIGLLALLPAFGFIYTYIFSKRTKSSLGCKIWWNMLRPIHGMLYILFAYYAINKDINAWIFLLLDVVIGIISFVLYNNNIIIV